MSNQKLSPAPGGGKTRSAKGVGDPRIGISPSTRGTGFPGTKSNGKVFANMSAGEASGPGQSMSLPKGPTMKGAPKKAPAEDSSSAKESKDW